MANLATTQKINEIEYPLKRLQAILAGANLRSAIACLNTQK